MIFLFFIFIHQFLPQHWYTTPMSVKPSERSLWKGWGCGYDPEYSSDGNLLASLYNSYKNATNKKTLNESIYHLLKKGSVAAKCVESSLYLFGVENFRQDNQISFDLLQFPEAETNWLCEELLVFHPLTKNAEKHLKKAASLGSVLAMIVLSESDLVSIDDSIQMQIHLISISIFCKLAEKEKSWL